MTLKNMVVFFNSRNIKSILSSSLICWLLSTLCYTNMFQVLNLLLPKGGMVINVPVDSLDIDAMNNTFLYKEILSCSEILIPLVISFSLLFISLFGVFYNRRNLIILMLCFEMLLLSSTFNFLYFSYLWTDIYGQISALYIITIAACESAIGLALVTSVYKVKGNINIRDLNILHD